MYGFPVPGVVASVGGGGTPLSEFSTGLLIATAGANVSPGSGTAWSTPGNITGLDDGLRATCFRSSAGSTQLLHATFNLSSIPDTATPVGIIARVRRDYSSSVPPQSVRDHTVRLTKDGTNMVGDNKADTASDWAHVTVTNVDYGGEGDLWGTTFTVAELKASTFGVMFRASHLGSTSMNPRVDSVFINVHYLD